jgi:hypothetical protein
VDSWWGLVGENGPPKCTLKNARLRRGLLALPHQGVGGSTQKALSKSEDRLSTLLGGELLRAGRKVSKGPCAELRVLEGLKVGLQCALLGETASGRAHWINSLWGGVLRKEFMTSQGQIRGKMSLESTTRPTITVGLCCALTGNTILAILRRGGCWPSVFYHHRGGGDPGRDHAGMPAGGGVVCVSHTPETEEGVRKMSSWRDGERPNEGGC